MLDNAFELHFDFNDGYCPFNWWVKHHGYRTRWCIFYNYNYVITMLMTKACCWVLSCCVCSSYVMKIWMNHILDQFILIIDLDKLVLRVQYTNKFKLLGSQRPCRILELWKQILPGLGILSQYVLIGVNYMSILLDFIIVWIICGIIILLKLCLNLTNHNLDVEIVYFVFYF